MVFGMSCPSDVPGGGGAARPQCALLVPNGKHCSARAPSAPLHGASGECGTDTCQSTLSEDNGAGQSTGSERARSCGGNQDIAAWQKERLALAAEAAMAAGAAEAAVLWARFDELGAKISSMFEAT